MIITGHQRNNIIIVQCQDTTTAATTTTTTTTNNDDTTNNDKQQRPQAPSSSESAPALGTPALATSRARAIEAFGFLFLRKKYASLVISKKKCTRKHMFTLLALCVSSLRRGHANLLCIVPSLTDDPRRESIEAFVLFIVFFSLFSRTRTQLAFITSFILLSQGHRGPLSSSFSISLSIHMYIRMYIYKHTYMYVCIYIHTCTYYAYNNNNINIHTQTNK